jgi:hypothetical protein
MVESRDELKMEIADEIGLNRMGENADNEEDNKDEVDNDKGDATKPPAATPPVVPAPPATVCEVIVVKEEDPVEMVPEQEAHEVILADVEPEPP